MPELLLGPAPAPCQAGAMKPSGPASPGTSWEINPGRQTVNGEFYGITSRIFILSAFPVFWKVDWWFNFGKNPFKTTRDEIINTLSKSVTRLDGMHGWVDERFLFVFLENFCNNSPLINRCSCYERNLWENLLIFHVPVAMLHNAWRREGFLLTF